MSAERLMDALQYIDDDLLEQADLMRSDDTVKEPSRITRSSKVVWLRRISTVAALAAASVLAVFALRFVNERKSADSAGAVPAEYALNSAATEEAEEIMMDEYAAAEESVEEAKEEIAATETTAAEAAEEYAMAEAAAESADMDDSAEGTVAYDTGTGQMNMLMAAGADVEVNEAAEAETAMAMAAEEPAAAEAMSGSTAAVASAKSETARSETAVMGTAGIRASVLKEHNVQYDGEFYSIELDGKVRQYRYLLEKEYTDPEGRMRTVYMLSGKQDLTDAEVEKAVGGALSADEIYILDIR